MPRHPTRFALSLLPGLLLAGFASAQQQLPGNALPNPRLSAIVPAGGRAGTVVEVTLSGTDLEGPQTLLFSHPSIKAELIPPPPPPPPAPKKPPAKPAKPAAAPPDRFKVTVGADVPVGIYDARLVNKWGVSNAR